MSIINDNFKKARKAITLGASGVIGTAADTVDTFSSFNITASVGLTFTLPTPTRLDHSDVVEIGAVNNSFIVLGQTIAVGEYSQFRWDGTLWQRFNKQVFSGNSTQVTGAGVVHALTKSNAYFSRTATIAASTNLDLPFTVSNIVGTDISLPTSTLITLTPSNGLTKSYLIRFNAKYSINTTGSHSISWGFNSPVAQTINGVAVAANAQFGSGATSYSTTTTASEFSNGILEYIITTAVPITFSIRIFGQTSTPTIGATAVNRFPTLIVEEI